MFFLYLCFEISCVLKEWKDDGVFSFFFFFFEKCRAASV